MSNLLEAVEARAHELLGRIGASPHALPWFETARDDLRPLVTEAGGVFRIVEHDRREIVRSDETRDPDELLFWVFEPVTERLARSWARQQRTDRDTFAFSPVARQLVLLGTLDPAWEARFRAENARSIAAAGG